MNVFWCGGEDIDFPTSTSGVTITTSSGYPYSSAQMFRSNYARCALQSAIFSNPAQSNPFSIGSATSFWFSFWLGFDSSMNPGDYRTCWLCGIGDPSNIKSGVWAGVNDYGQIFVEFGNPSGITYSGVSTAIPFVNGIAVGGRVCVQVSGFGTGSTVATVYWNSAPLATSSAFSTIGYTTNLSLGIAGGSANANWITAGGSQNASWLSEFIVADSDLRSCSLATLAPAGAGTTDQWSGSYTGVNEVTINDSNPISTSTAAQVEEFTLTTPPSGIYSVLATKIAARCAASSGSPVTNIQLGFNQGGTVAVGADQAPTVPFATYEQLNTTNPVTTAAWLQSDLTGLQVAIKSET